MIQKDNIGQVALGVAIAGYVLPAVCVLILYSVTVLFPETERDLSGEFLGGMPPVGLCVIVGVVFHLFAVIAGVLSVVLKTTSKWFGVAGALLGLLTIASFLVVFFKAISAI